MAYISTVNLDQYFSTFSESRHVFYIGKNLAAHHQPKMLQNYFLYSIYNYNIISQYLYLLSMKLEPV